MKLTHLNATAKLLGYEDIEDFLVKSYIEKKMSIEAMADEVDLGVGTIRKLLGQFKIEKPKKEIPLSVADARRMGPDALAKLLNVSRATAWRWKREVIAREAARAAAAADASPDADGW